MPTSGREERDDMDVHDHDRDRDRDAREPGSGGAEFRRNGRSSADEGQRGTADLARLADRLPPQAIESEMALLGSMLLDPVVIGDVIQIVRSAEDFYRPAHASIYAVLVESYDRHNAGDIAMVHQALRDKGLLEAVGGSEYLIDLAESVPAAVNAPHYARVVAEKAVVRRLINAAGEILRKAHAAGDDVRALLDEAERAIFEIAQHSQRSESQPLPELLVQAMEAIESRLEEGAITGLRTGFRGLDELTSGFQSGDMIILAARPSMGKTAFALNVAENVALLGKAVGIFSLEMGRQQLAQRLLCSRSEVDSQRLRRNFINKEEFGALLQAMDELSQAPIHIDDTPGLSILELRAKARRMASKHELGLVVIDYLQLMSGPSREGRQQEVAEISRGVKALARELDVPVMCLSQLNRAAEHREDKRPRLSDLRESGSIEQDADVVMMLHREDYYRQHQEDYEPSNVAELIIAKQRNGPTDTVKLTWVGSSTKFKDFSGRPDTTDWGGRVAPADGGGWHGRVDATGSAPFDAGRGSPPPPPSPPAPRPGGPTDRDPPDGIPY